MNRPMTPKQAEIAKFMMTELRLSFHKRTGRFYLLTRDRSGEAAHKASANAMVLRGIVVPCGGDANWDDYELSPTVRQRFDETC